MMSTPMSSSISATSSFSSKVMVAPGHCSPSRKVVSKMTTRSFSDLFTVVISKIPCQWCAAVGALKGSGDLAQPLSAQAQTPRRPSGADKKQKPAKKPGGQGRSRNRFGTGDNQPFSRELQTFCCESALPDPLEARSSAKTIDGWLPRQRPRAVLDEKYRKPQCQKMVSQIVSDTDPFPSRPRGRVLAARYARGLQKNHPRKKRAQGKPGADCTHGSRAKKARG